MRHGARATIGLSALVGLVGLVLVVETAIFGGGIGLLLGAIFILAGVGRLYLSLR